MFANFFLIISAYYHIKPASRSLAIEYIGVDKIPYLWIASAVLLGLLMPGYQWLVKHSRRKHLKMYSIISFMGLLLVCYPFLLKPGMNSTICFYLLADIFSVVLVEQFWSLSNSSITTQQGKRWYGLIASGGLIGGIFAGFFASWLIKSWGFSTQDLLLVAAFFLVLLFLLNTYFTPQGIYREQPQVITDPKPVLPETVGVVRRQYLIYITLLLCLAQLIEPIVEYQFLKVVELAFSGRDERTAYISFFLGWLGIFSVFINLMVTPLIHRWLGVIGGLSIQPICVFLSAIVFSVQSNLLMGSILKIADRGLSYSINRASKELLYVPIPMRQLYQLKAWIDMFGYRLFKLSGAFLILIFTQWSLYRLELEEFSYILLVTAALWILIVFFGIRKEYQLALNTQQNI